MKPGPVSKLAAQAADFYETALDLMQSATLKTVLPKVSKWLLFIANF